MHDKLPTMATVVADELDALRRVVSGLDDADLVTPTACTGWQVAHLLVHLRLDAEALVEGLLFPSSEPPDRDRVSYWRDWPPGSEVTFAQVRWHWANAAAYASGEQLRGHVDDTVSAAAAAARAAGSRDAASGAARRLTFQTHVLDEEDLLAMWVVEFAVHHLDLVVGLPGREPPSGAALAVATETVDALVQGTRAEGWDDVTYLRKATGRAGLDDDERASLGAAVARLPVFG